MNRYTTLTFNKLNAPLLQLPYQELDALLSSQQQQIDTTGKLLLARPRYIEQSKGDVELAGKISKWQSDVQKQLVDIAKTGNTSDYLGAMKQVQNEIVNLYSPGGAGYALESRYSAFQKERERITEATSKYKNPLYKPYFEENLLKQLKDTDIYNQRTRTSKSIQPANIFGEVMVGEEIDKYFKDWAKSKDVDIRNWVDSSGKVNPYYLEKYTVEGVTKEELQDALGTFYNQPHIQQALGIDAWNMKSNMSPEQQLALVAQSESARELKLESAIQQEQNKLNILEKKKDTDAVKQIVEAAGFKNFDEYKQSVLKSFEDAKILIKENPLTIDAAIAEDVKQKYSNAYIPKYAVTREDRDLIQYAPAIEALRHSYKKKENQQMLDGLEALYKNPNSIFYQGEFDAIKQKSAGLIDGYIENQNGFVQVENLLNTPQYRNLKGTFTGINNQSQTEQLMLVKNAAQASTKNGKIDPVLFAEYINENGGKVTQDGAVKMVEYLNKPSTRTTLESFLDMAEPAYNNLEMSKASIQDAVKSIPDDATFWKQVAVSKGYLKQRIISGPNIGTIQYEGNTDAAIKRAQQDIQSGNFDVRLLKAYLPEEIETASAVTVRYNPNMDKYYESLKNGLNVSLGAIVAKNITTLSEEQLKTIGYDKKGKYVGDSPDPIVQINVGTKTINGKKQQVYILKGKYGDKPVILTPDQLGSQFNRDFLLGEASQTMNPDNFGEIINEQVFNDISSTYFDDLIPNNITVDNVRTSMNTGKQIGTFYEPISQMKVVTKVVTDAQTGTPYLLGISADANKNLGKYRQGNTYDVAAFNKNHRQLGIEAIPILSNDNNAIINAISEMKAGWGKPSIQYELETHPDKVVKSKSNMTGMAPFLLTQ